MSVAKSSTLGVGVVGAGIVFEEHARACAQLQGRAQLRAVAEPDETRLGAAAARHSIPFASRDHGELLRRDDIDVVVVSTPPRFHEQVVVGALEAGKFVVCEKPLAHTLEAADRIVEAAREFPGKLSTVYQFRYLPEVERTIWLRDNGHLGQLLFGRFHRNAVFNNPWKVTKPGKTPKPLRRDWWGSFAVAGGGVVMTQLIHELDLMQHIFGAPAGVSAVVDTLKEQIESEDTCAATVRFESGAIASCYGTIAAQRSESGFEVIGTEGSAHSPWAVERMDPERRWDSRRAVLAAHPDARLEPGSSAHTPYLKDVLDAIEAGRPLPIGPEDGRAALELATAIYASALSGGAVSLPLDETSPYYGGVTAADYAARERRLEGVA
jgi:UDP-N-acetyl-2-amino-2-deoxyglucuronate dehydrogenase